MPFLRPCTLKCCQDAKLWLRTLSSGSSMNGKRGCQMVYFQTQSPKWLNFGGPQIGKFWYILWTFGIVFGHLGYFMTIWYMLCSFGTFFPFW
jgi:hypothetical protein